MMNNDSGSKNNARRKEFSNEMRQNIGNKLMDRFTELRSQLNALDRNSLCNCYQTSMQYEGKGFHSMTSKFVQQRDASEQKQQPLCLQKPSNSLQQPLLLKDNVFVTPQPVTLGVSNSNVLNFQQQHGTPKKNFLPTEAMQKAFQHFPSLYQYQCLLDQQKLHNAKRALPEASSLIEQSEISCSHLYKRQKQIVSEPPQYQHFQTVAMKNLQGKQSSEQYFNNTAIVHQNQKFVQQRNASEQKQQPLCLQKTSNSPQQPLVLKENVSVMRQPVNLGVSKFNALKHGPAKKSCLPTEVMQEGLQHFRSSRQAKDLADQQTIPNSKPAHPEASTAREASASNEILNVADWHHQAYRELESLRTECLPTLNLFQKFEKNRLESKSELPDSHKREMSQLVRMSNMNHSVVSRLSSATCPQSAVSSTLVDAQTELQSLTAQPIDHQCAVVTDLNPSVASQLSSATCTQSSVSSILVDAQTELQSLTAQPIDHQCAVVSNFNSSEASGLSSATFPQSVVSSTLVDGQTEHQSPRVQPIDRLCAAVQSVSPGALLSSIEDIFSVVSSAGIFSGTTIDNNPRAALREDLAYATRCHLVGQHLHTSAKHDITPHAFDALIPSIDETEPIGASGNKRQKTEAKYHLLDEIKRINHRLIETVVDMESSEVDLKTEVIKAKVVQCSYIPMAIRKAYKSNISSDAFPELKLRVLVPADYPNASPTVLDSLTAESTSDKSKEITEKAKLKLGISVCLLSKPFSLEDMARAWDQCCRAVFCDFAHTQGGGSFSSRFGSWEVCSI